MEKHFKSRNKFYLNSLIAYLNVKTAAISQFAILHKALLGRWSINFS